MCIRDRLIVAPIEAAVTVTAVTAVSESLNGCMPMTGVMARRPTARMAAAHGAATLVLGKKSRRQQAAQAKLQKRFHEHPNCSLAPKRMRGKAAGTNGPSAEYALKYGG